MRHYRIFWPGAPDERHEELDVEGEDHEDAAQAWAEELELGDLVEEARIIVEPRDDTGLGWHMVVRRRQAWEYDVPSIVAVEEGD